MPGLRVLIVVSGGPVLSSIMSVSVTSAAPLSGWLQDVVAVQETRYSFPGRAAAAARLRGAGWYGNARGAGSGSVLSQGWDKWRDEDDVAVVGVGGGLTWASYLVRFGAGDAE